MASPIPHEVPKVDLGEWTRGSDLQPVVERFVADRNLLRRSLAISGSPQGRATWKTFYSQWQKELAKVPFAKLTFDGQVDYLLLKNHLAREARPYDEEFLLAALLHDVGKTMGMKDHAATAVDALRGAVTDRTLWLIAHHMDLIPDRYKKLGAKQRREIEESEYSDDLKLLRECDDAGRVPGVVVESLEEALDYIRGLEGEEYLDV